MAPPIRFGIIACSSIGRRRFLPALRNSAARFERARLERIGSRDPSRAQQFASQFSCAKFGSYEEVLADPEVDAVYISTPPTLHEEWIMKAIEAGKHVLCEKPAFCDFASAQAAVGRCRERGVRLMDGYCFKLHPQHAAARAMIEQGRIGRPRFFYGEYHYPRPPENDIRHKPEIGGGIFGDSAGYPIAAALMQLSPRPVSVFCQSDYDRTTGVDNAFAFWLGFADGEMAQGLVAFESHYRSSYTLTGTQGRIQVLRAFSVPPDKETRILLETETGEETSVFEPVDQFSLMIDEFCGQVRGTSPRHDFEKELLLQHAVMDACARSRRERRAIDLSEYPL